MAGSIEPVDDPELARAFLEKVNRMNRDTGRDVFIATALWSALPQDVAASIASVGIVVAGLYLIRDTIPGEVS